MFIPIIAQQKPYKIIGIKIDITKEMRLEKERDMLQQADLPQESTSTGRFGTSMSARRILGLKQVPRVWLFAN